MSQKALLRMSAPLREDIHIPYHDLGTKDKPPKAALVAGLHGNELNGVFALSRLANFLQGVEENRHPGQELCERVVIIPAVNVLGLNLRSRTWPFDQTDINRMFPGYDAGETTQRVAQAVLDVTRPAYYRIDIHNSNLDFEELPQVRLYAPTDRERMTACLFGLPAVIERPTNTLFTTTIGHAWQALGGENFVIQIGQAGNLQLPHCQQLFRALVAFLQRTGIVKGVSLSEEEEEVHTFGFNQAVPLLAETAGWFVSHLEVGHWLKVGEPIGYVYDSFDGRLRAEITAPVSGLLSGIRRQPLLCEGDLIARIYTNRPVVGGSDIHLHSQEE